MNRKTKEEIFVDTAIEAGQLQDREYALKQAINSKTGDEISVLFKCMETFALQEIHAFEEWIAINYKIFGSSPSGNIYCHTSNEVTCDSRKYYTISELITKFYEENGR